MNARGRIIRLTGELWDEVQTAEFLGLQRTTLQRWRWSGRGPRFVKLGSAVRYRKVDILAFVESGLRSSTSEANS